MTEHGTTTGYQHHKCRCAACRDAATAAMRARRATNSVQRAYDKQQAAAYRAALRQLRGAHRDEFNRYYAAARKERDLS